MKKIIARELAPENVDFSYYFDNDGFRGEYAFYIPATTGYRGFNDKEYQEILRQAEHVLDVFEDYFSGYFENEEDVLGECAVLFTSENLSERFSKLKEWAEDGWRLDIEDIAEFLRITTGKKWETVSFRGYSQGDFCEILYPTEHYSKEAINEIGHMWLGCGTEFSIDGCYGYFVVDELRWEEGEKLRQYLADCYGCKPDELEIHLYRGDRRVPVYEIM